jgi:hypothetical protein
MGRGRRELEAERARLDEAIERADENAEFKAWLGNLTPKEARQATLGSDGSGFFLHHKRRCSVTVTTVTVTV